MTTDCPHCKTNAAIYDLNRLCCAARFLASLPTRASMARTAEAFQRRHGHTLEDLRREVVRIQREQAEAALAAHVPR
jgi:hypothetical protein